MRTYGLPTPFLSEASDVLNAWLTDDVDIGAELPATGCAGIGRAGDVGGACASTRDAASLRRAAAVPRRIPTNQL